MDNQEADKGLSADDSREQLIDGIGEDVYNDLTGKIGQSTMDLLLYDTGVSNMVRLINEVIICGGTADKIVDLISPTVSSPNKIAPETALAMINQTDEHLRTEPVLPSGDDTIAKVANMICNVTSMDDLVYIVNQTPDYAGAGTPPETESIERITLILALIDENEDAMPTIINEVADTAAGRDKLTRLLSEIDDLRKMATVLNDTDEIINLLTVVDLVDGTAAFPNGVDALITTMNLITKPEDMAYMMNQLDAALFDINNDENFETGDLNYQNWATTGPQTWYVDNADASEGSFSARTNPALNDLEVSSLELAANITTAGNISFDFKVSSEANDYLKFYIDDVLQGLVSGNVGWTAAAYPVTAGVHRFRWEYVKDASGTGGGDFARVDNVILPGDKGTARTASEKTAIMLNQLDITAQETVADMLNGVNSDTWGYQGLDNLVQIVNSVEYPLNLSDEPRLVTIVNDISNIPTMTELLRGQTAIGVDNMVEIVDHAPDVSQMADLINQMDTAGLGTKTTDILNGLTSTGAINLASLVDGVNNTDLVDLIDNATTVSHMSDILNEIYLQGSPQTITVGGYTGPSGGAKLTDVMNRVDASASLDINPHLVRLLNDIADSPLGPSAVGQLVGLMDPASQNAPGTERMVKLMEILNNNGTPAYTNPLSNETTDDFGRIIELIKAMSGNGPWNLARIINELECNDINNSSDCRVYNASDMVKDSNRVVYVSRLIAEMTNVQLVIDLLNDPATDFNKIQTLLNIVGDDTYGVATIGVPPTDTYDNLYEYPAVDDDYLGRLIITINNIAGSQGIGNMIALVNGVNYVDAQTDNFSILIDMISNTHRIVYMTRMISDATDLSLVIDLLNEIDPGNATERAKLQTLVNTLGDNTYGAGTGIATDPSPFYTDAMETSTTDQIGRMIVFINDLNAEVQATGSSQAQAIYNAVTMILDSYDLNYIIDFLTQVERIQYVTNMVAQIDNIGLMMTIINGESGNGSDGAELGKLLTLMNNYGGSTRFGAGSKAVGDMTMFADVVDILGAGRPLSDQAKIVRLMNEVIYCGIVPSSDLTITGAGSPSDFFGCDSHVDYDYDSNKGSVAYDQRHRLSNLMLGLDSANTMAILVGDIGDTTKTIRFMNGTRRINSAIYIARWMPAEVTRDLINYTNLSVMYSSLVYLANNLAPTEDEAAQAFASMLHYGTGISHVMNRQNGSNCHWYEAVGPKRTAELLNIEPGAYLETILQMFGWRSSIPAMGCAFGTPGASGSTQSVTGTYGTGTFADVENVYENDDGSGSPSGALLYSYGLPSNSNWCRSTGTGTTQIGYIPEESGALGYFEHSDTTVWSGFAPLPGVSVDPGLGGLWQVLKGEGIVGWLLQNGGSVGAPPVDTTQYGSPSCTNGSYGNEWDCVKHGKDSGDHISDHRWGNFCTLPGYTTPASCEGNGGRWTPDKNWSACY